MHFNIAQNNTNSFVKDHELFGKSSKINWNSANPYSQNLQKPSSQFQFQTTALVQFKHLSQQDRNTAHGEIASSNI